MQLAVDLNRAFYRTKANFIAKNKNVRHCYPVIVSELRPLIA